MFTTCKIKQYITLKNRNKEVKGIKNKNHSCKSCTIITAANLYPQALYHCSGHSSEQVRRDSHSLRVENLRAEPC